MNEKINFLDNFEKRMEKLSYTYLIDYQVDKKSLIFDKYNIDRQDMINIVYSTLCFIMDKTLKDEDCLMDDIVEFLSEILNNYYDFDRELSNEDINEIARYIIVKVLRNDGKQFNFKIKNYSSNKTEIVNYYLIKSQPSLIDKTISSYKLTEEGYRLLLNTYETDQRLQVELQSIILTESIKRRNFKNGISTIRQMDNIIRVQISNVKEMIRQIRENIFEIKIDNFSKMYLENINIIREQKENLLKIERLILKSQEDIRNAVTIEKENEEALKDLSEIKDYVDKLIEQSTIMVDYHFDLKEEYLKALRTISQNFNKNHLSLLKTYMMPIEENIKILDNAHLLFQPLIKPNTNKILNYNKILDELKIIQDDKSEEDINIDNIEDVENRDELENQRIKKIYFNSVDKLLDNILFFLENGIYQFTIYDLINNLSVEDYVTLIPNIRIFTEIIIYLLRMGTINLTDIYIQNKNAYFDASSKFDIIESLLEFIVKKDLVNEHISISFTKIENDIIKISEHTNEDDIVKYIAEMNNININVEKEKQS